MLDGDVLDFLLIKTLFQSNRRHRDLLNTPLGMQYRPVNTNRATGTPREQSAKADVNGRRTVQFERRQILATPVAHRFHLAALRYGLAGVRRIPSMAETKCLIPCSVRQRLLASNAALENWW